MVKKMNSDNLLGVIALMMLPALHMAGCDTNGTAEEDFATQRSSNNNRGDNPTSPDSVIDDNKALHQAVAVLSSTSGSSVSGTVMFEESPSGDVAITGTMIGLDTGKHGFHIHETGNCSAVDASSAGPHFSPEDDQHGAKSDPADERHAGDLGNVNADERGRASIELLRSDIDFSGDNSILGRAVVVHREADDFESQPSGDAGKRIACGVIRKTIA